MPKTRFFSSLAFVTPILAASAAPADEGMWLPTHLPAKHLKSQYGFESSPAWLEHIQKSCVRIGAGGSGSVVSADGLVMTNHHVGSDAIANLSTADRDLLKTGFYAKSRAEEAKCPNTEVEILWSVEDTTDRVNAAVKPDMSPADANAARKKAINELVAEAEKKANLRFEMITLYHGARYHLYGYRRFTDVRLVMAPEESIAFFGGDNDNFEYPRYDLDMSFFRLYENDKPFQAEHYLKWNKSGLADGELTFVAGHPGRTQRLFTVEHLKFLRDVDFPSVLARMWRREVQIHTFCARNAEFARIGNEDARGVENGRKAYTGILAGLQNPAIIAAKKAAEDQLRAKVNANPDYKTRWADAWDKVAAAEQNYRGFYTRHSFLEGRRAAMRSDLYSIARHLVRLADELPKPNSERLKEYTDSGMKTVELQLYSDAPIYDDLEIHRLETGLASLGETFGCDDPLVLRAYAGKSPRERAEECVRGTKLKDIAIRRKLAAGGSQAIKESNDPLIQLVLSIDPEARAARKRYEDEVESVEREAYARIAAAQFALNGEDMYPDATFSLRVSFGPVKGYEESGRKVSPFTNFTGLYQRYQERKGQKGFELPQRWLDRKGKLKLDTPFNFVCTADIIGGNSGSPVINKAGEVVGLVFDGNIQGLVWDIAYTDEQARCVAVDARAIIESLKAIYDAGPLADELTKG